MNESDKERWTARGEYEELREMLKKAETEYKSFACRLRDIIPPCEPEEFRKGVDIAEAHILLDKIEVAGIEKTKLNTRIKEIKSKWKF